MIDKPLNSCPCDLKWKDDLHFGFWNYDELSSVENPGWLFDIGDYTTQLYGDYNKPI